MSSSRLDRKASLREKIWMEESINSCWSKKDIKPTTLSSCENSFELLFLLKVGLTLFRWQKHENANIQKMFYHLTISSNQVESYKNTHMLCFIILCKQPQKYTTHASDNDILLSGVFTIYLCKNSFLFIKFWALY